MSAYNLAEWLIKQGAIVGVLTSAKTPDEVYDGKEMDGITVWRAWFPRAYPMYYASKAKWWQKPLWHLQDHFDPRNRKIVARVIQEFKPDYINIHLLQGVGYNTLLDIANSKAPTTFFLHDLGLACVRMGMFKKGRACARQCTICKVSSAYKLRCIQGVSPLNFVSPSCAILDILAKYFPVKKWPHAAIMNVNRYPVPTVDRMESAHVRILYIGRLHVTKGVDILLEAANNLAAKYNFTLTIIGSGPDEARLREQYGRLPWCKFTGFVTQQDISNYIVNSDVLCIPSIWAENSPGVVIHALSLGLPAIGSDKAGIPELIENRKNGLLVPPGDIPAWQAALEEVLHDPSVLVPWRAYALENTYKFDQDYVGRQLLQVFDFIYKQPRLS